MSRIVVAWFVVVAACFAGCRALPETRYYMLELHPPDAVSPQGDGLIVGVRPFRVDPPYDGDRIVYRIGEDSPEVGFYAYHRWAAPLARMLSTVVADGLSGADGVARIEPMVPGRRYTAHLEGRLLALEEIDLPGAQQLRLHLQLRLVADDGETLWSASVDERTETSSRQVAELVRGLAAGVSRRLDEARASLSRALQRRAGGGGSLEDEP